MDTPIVLCFYIKHSSNSSVIRSIVLKEYFRKLTSNVEVLYPTQVHNGLLLCKSQRTGEKIFNMRHVLPDGSIIHLSKLSRALFQQGKCSIDAHIMQVNEISTSMQQALPFLHASGGKIQVNSDGSVLLEGHIFILNSIHSFLGNKKPHKQQSTSTAPSETFELRSGNIVVKVMSGKLIEQNVEGVLIPMSDKYKIHKAFDRQIQALGGTSFSNYFKDLRTKGTRTHEGEIILFPNRELKIPAKVLIIFTVPRLSNNETTKDKSMFDSYQPTYEQMIYRALQTIDQNSISSLAMPILEPNVKTSKERRYANEMTNRAMVSSILQFSHSTPIKLKRIVIIDHHVQIKRMSKRVKKFQNQLKTKPTINNNIDLDADEGLSFTNIFGVPKIPELGSTTSESEDEIEPEEYEHPYADLAKS